MLAPLLLMTIGGIMVYSALKGIGITDVLSGQTGNPLNPSGHAGGTTSGNGSTPTDPSSSDLQEGQTWTAPAGQAHGFKGSHATELNNLAGVAQNNFHLTITSTNGGGHVPGSLHYAGEAFDASGSESNMRGFAQYVQDHYANQISELIHNPGFAVKDGQVVHGNVAYAAQWAGHRNHVHVGWK